MYFAAAVTLAVTLFTGFHLLAMIHVHGAVYRGGMFALRLIRGIQ